MVTVHLNERTLPLKRPLKTAQGLIPLRRSLVIVLQDSAGSVGLGEASPLPAFGSEDFLSCQEALEAVLPELPIFAQKWLDRERPDAGLGPLERKLAKTPCARACIEGALLDLFAKRQGRPLADVLRSTIDDEPVLRSLPVNPLLAGGTPEELAEAASALVADGWRTLKLKCDSNVEKAIEQILALREWVGQAIHLRVDVNGAWNLKEAQAFCEATEGAKLEFLEQPLPADALDDLATLSQSVRVPIALDESIRTAGDIGRIASHNAGKIVVLKPMALGGWKPTRQAAELARNLELGVIITTFLDGSIGRGLATHMAAALQLCDYAQGLATGGLMKEDLTDAPLKAKKGSVTLSEEPGLGIGYLLPEVL